MKLKRVAHYLAALLVVPLPIASMSLSSYAADNTIKVGVVLPLTGEQAKFGEIEKNSFLMALDAVNESGGVNGKKIELIIEDDTGKPDIGRSAVEKLIYKDNVVALTGGYSSSVAFAMCQVAQQRKVPFLVTTGSADRITEQNWNQVFRIAPPVSEYPSALESFLKEVVKAETVAVLYENTLFGQSGSKEFVEQCPAWGLKVLTKEGYEAGAVDFKPLLVKVKSAKPDLVYMISYLMDSGLLMRQSKELDFNPKLFVGGGAGFILPEFAKNAGEAGENVFSIDLWASHLPYPGAKEYYDQFLAEYGFTPDTTGLRPMPLCRWWPTL